MRRVTRATAGNLIETKISLTRCGENIIHVSVSCGDMRVKTVFSLSGYNFKYNHLF